MFMSVLSYTVNLTLVLSEVKTLKFATKKWTINYIYMCIILMISPSDIVCLKHLSNMYSKITLVQYITKWKHYIVWRRHRKEQYCIADKHFSSKLLPK